MARLVPAALRAPLIYCWEINVNMICSSGQHDIHVFTGGMGLWHNLGMETRGLFSILLDYFFFGSPPCPVHTQIKAPVTAE